MSKNWIIIILILIIIILIFYPKQETTSDILKEINKLELKLDSLSSKKDSIRVIIDSTNYQIINNNKHYEEVVNNITNQSSYWDSMYIADYIGRFAKSRGLDLR